MTHPAIPLNCPYFEESKNGAGSVISTYFVWLEEKEIDICFTTISSLYDFMPVPAIYRPVIAAMAYLGWHDEYDRYHAAFFEVLRIMREWGLSDGRFGGLEGFALDECERLKLAADDHAEAWREWRHG
jgi:hypothetical protein